ncbi:MAG: GGDEF domain-containing protein [Candidatus Obscuribacterales bacterium]|nr:GGDEF domain-containing protein [Candidatus Obscuribacterales bacterium]
MPTFDKDQVPLFAREGLFRQKLNQLRNTGAVNQPVKPQGDAHSRYKELEQGSYLSNVQSTIGTSKGDQQEAERIALLDSVTELYNRNTVTRILRDELKRTKRYKHSLGILVIKVDELTKAGKTHGQNTFDSILKGTANFIMSKVRDVDIPARYDSDTFLVICPETDPKGVSVLAERIRSKIMLERVSDVGQNWHVTVSQGIAGYPGNALKAEDLLQSAIDAANKANASGGNQTVTAATQA